MTVVPRLSSLACLVAAVLVAGMPARAAAQSSDSVAAKPKADSGMTKGQAKREKTLNDVPDWFMSPPTDTAFVLVTATATSGDLQMALDKARLQGRLNISEELETRLEGLGKRFMGEVNQKGAKPQLVSQYEQTTKSVVSQVLRGSRVREQQWYNEADQYRVYVLMELPMAKAKAELVEEAKANKAMYTQMKASKSFRELEKEVSKLTGEAP